MTTPVDSLDLDTHSQGKIHTQNPDLLSLLTEDSRDNLFNKRDNSFDKSNQRHKFVRQDSLDVNNNTQIDKNESELTEETGVESRTGRDNFPKPKPSASLPSARSQADVKDFERSRASSVYAVANPDILRASGITPTQPNQFFPKYVSLKSRSQETPRTSNLVVSSPPENIQEEEPTKYRETEDTPIQEESSRQSPDYPEPVSVSPEKESPLLVKHGRKSFAAISADSLDFNDGDLDKYLTVDPQEETEVPEEPSKPPSIVIQEDTFDSKPVVETATVDNNLLQAPGKSLTQLKSHNPQSPPSEADRSRDSVTSVTSERSRVFVVSNDSGSMSGSRGRKVFVESPTFTKDEEDEYRFVSSRVDDYQDMTDTYRQLDENTLEQKPKKKTSGKRVTYQDSDRFEDRNQIDFDDDVKSGQRSAQGQNVTYKSALKNPSPQRQNPSPPKGIKLPDDPTDPVEQEELDREGQYQNVLKQRIHDYDRTIEVEAIPKLPLSPDTSRDFVQDSLDMAGENYRQNRGGVARDSLELYQGPSDRNQGASRYGEMENTTWRNPPPQPFDAPPPQTLSAPPYEENEGQGQFQRQNAMDGYISEPDYQFQQRRDEYEYPEPVSNPQQFPEHNQQNYRYPQNQDVHRNPERQNQQRMNYQNQNYQNQDVQILQNHPIGGSYQNQPQYYDEGIPHQAMHAEHQSGYQNPQQYQNPGYFDNSQSQPRRNPHISSFGQEDRGMYQSYDSEPSYRPTYNEHFQNNQNGGSAYQGHYGNYDQRSDNTGDYSIPAAYSDRFVNENIEPNELSSPRKPKYDYVHNNRIDYGKQPPKSYKQIRDIKNEEKIRAESMFMRPKVKPKQSQFGSAHEYPQHRPANDPPLPLQMSQKPASAEDLWAQRAASLQQRSAGKQPKRKGKLVKYPSDSGLSPSLNTRAPLPRPAFLPPNGGVSPPKHMLNMTHSPPHSFPSSPARRPLELKPISQEVVTSDGQRISVDVNLKLMSPPPPMNFSEANLSGQSGYAQDVSDFVPVGHQYPIDYQQDNPAHYPDLPTGSSQSYDPYQGDSVDKFGTPYNKIPPIPSSGESKASKQHTDPDDGYVAQFRKKQEKQQLNDEDRPWYKVYDIRDYRKMQKEVRLGTLGPDLDNNVHKERMEKVQRQTQYSRMVMEKNKQQSHYRKPPSFPKPKEQDDIMNKRKVAIEYAKTVPKPALTKPMPNEYNSYEVASQSMSPHGTKQRYNQPVVDVIDLDKLQQRHERDKQNVAKIRENMDGVAQNA